MVAANLVETAELLSPIPYEHLMPSEKNKYRVDGQSVNYAALYQYEPYTQKGFQITRRSREALNYAINARRWQNPRGPMQRQLLV